MARRATGCLLAALCVTAVLAGCSSSGSDGQAAAPTSTTTSTSAPTGQLECSEPALVEAAQRFATPEVHVTGVSNFRCGPNYAVGLTACDYPTRPTEQCQVALMLFRGTSGTWEVIKAGEWTCAEIVDVGDKEGCFALGLPA